MLFRSLSFAQSSKNVAYTDALKLATAAAQSPVAASAAFQQINYASAQAYLARSLIVALALEELRFGNADQARARLEQDDGMGVPFAVVAGYLLDGGDAESLFGLNQSDFATVLFIRSRQLATLGKSKEAAAQLADALLAEPIPGWIAKLAAAWPPATAPSQPLRVGRLVQ